MSIGAVIFDFNGVLVDDESIHCSLFTEVLAQEGVTLSEKDYHERYLGFDDRKCFESVLRDSHKSTHSDHLDHLIAQKAQRYVEVASQGLRFSRRPQKPCEPSQHTGRWQFAQGALRAEIEYSLVRLDRLDEITAIISAEDTTRCKPDPEGYQLALAAIRRNARNGKLEVHRPTVLASSACLVIEDSLAGIISAKGAGMCAVGVPNTYTPEQLFQAGADDVVPGLVSLTPTWIKQRFAM